MKRGSDPQDTAAADVANGRADGERVREGKSTRIHSSSDGETTATATAAGKA